VARAGAALLLLGLGLGVVPALAGPSPQRTVRVRVAAKGPPNGASANARISGNGRYVAFETLATNLGPHDGNGHVRDVYRYDDKSAEIRLLSAAPDGGGADGPSSAPAISTDGSVVAFSSRATNIVPRASNAVPDAAPHGDVFVWSSAGGLAQASVSSTQVPADGDSGQPDVSGEGRLVAFSSTAGNLVDGHPAGQRDVYVRDAGSGTTVLVSATPDGQPGDGDSSAPAISPDGRYVSFATTATNLVPDATTHGPNVVVRDLVAGTTELASVSAAGDPQAGGRAPASPPVSDVSAAGRYVVFESAATNLVDPDTNRRTDVFVRDTVAKRTFRASLATTDQQADGDSYAPSISADGRYVTFLSRAPNLTPGQPAGVNVFLRDLVRHTTVMADVASSGRPRSAEQAAGVSEQASSADDGLSAVFVSSARNLVADKRSRLPDVFLRRLSPSPISIASPAAGLARGHVVITFISVDRQAGPLLCRLDHKVRAICPIGAVVLPLLTPGKHVLTAYAGGPGSQYAPRPTTVRITIRRGGRARVKVTNPGTALGLG
jgi:Tol biopolymer transport system component